MDMAKILVLPLESLAHFTRMTRLAPRSKTLMVCSGRKKTKPEPLGNSYSSPDPDPYNLHYATSAGHGGYESHNLLSSVNMPISELTHGCTRKLPHKETHKSSETWVAFHKCTTRRFIDMTHGATQHKPNNAISTQMID